MSQLMNSSGQDLQVLRSASYKSITSFPAVGSSKAFVCALKAVAFGKWRMERGKTSLLNVEKVSEIWCGLERVGT